MAPPILPLDGLRGNDPIGDLGALAALLSSLQGEVAAFWACVGAFFIGAMATELRRRGRRPASETRPGCVAKVPYAVLLVPPVLLGLVVRANLDPPEANAEARRDLVRLSDRERERVGRVVARASGNASVGQKPSNAWVPTIAGRPIHVAFHRAGVRIADAWTLEDGTLDPLADAVHALRLRAGVPDMVEVSIARDFRPDSLPIANIDRGLLGLEFSHGGEIELVAPSALLVDGSRGPRELESFAARTGVDPSDVQVRAFATLTLIIGFDPETQVEEVVRGNTLVDLEDVDREHVERFVQLASQFLERNVLPDGRMRYHVEPRTGAEIEGNNMIRQWMATLALERVARRRGDHVSWDLAARNIDHNLAHFYAEDGDGRGLIRWEGEVKLGAVSLAALAIVEHPERSRWARQEAALRRAIDGAWAESGKFTTFLEPAGKTGQNNFYPGETLLLWARLIERGEGGDLLRKSMQSFRYYRNWHLQPGNRNPAFVPWHTMADVSLWHRTRDPALAEFVFEMNDWLLGVQEWDENSPYPDVQGRFYDPRRPFGPPHASSTGVYLEGLVAAYGLALELGEWSRARNYRDAIRRGLRNILQLQLDDDIDMFFVPDSQRAQIVGGVRTTEYDARIRCDNVQHPLMAAIDILDRFSDAEFAGEDRAAVFGSIDVHDAVEDFARPSGTVVVRLRRIADGTVAWASPPRRAEFPLRYTVPEVAWEPGLAAYVDVRHRPRPGSDGVDLGGEGWSAAGKPIPIVHGSRVDVSLNRIAEPDDRVPPILTNDEPSGDPVLVRGTIRAHPELEARLEQGGFVHVRLISLELGRPFAFARLDAVDLPASFTIRAHDQFYPTALDRADTHRFYVDATYDPPGLEAGYGLFRWRPPAVTGEAWGEGGPPASLTRGADVDIVLDRYWSSQELRGQLEHRDGALAEGWLYVAPGTAVEACADNRLTVALRSDQILAVARYEDVDTARPVAYHLTRDDFRVAPEPSLHAYFSAWLECFERGRRASVLIGGRASAATTISAYPRTLHIALWERSASGPESAGIEAEPGTPPMYR